MTKSLQRNREKEKNKIDLTISNEQDLLVTLFSTTITVIQISDVTFSEFKVQRSLIFVVLLSFNDISFDCLFSAS